MGMDGGINDPLKFGTEPPMAFLLKARFGDDIHIGGDVAQTEAGDLELTVRGDGLLPRTFSAPSDQLFRLTIEVAQYVYSQSQPALWVSYLVESARYREAIEFCQASIESVPRSEQPVLLGHWASAIAHTKHSVLSNAA